MVKNISKPNRFLRVDLSNEEISTETLPNDFEYIGGKGFGVHHLLKELKPGIDPISHDNILIFAWGPMTALAPASSRYAVITKSPLTGAFLDCYCGGNFPANLRFALFDYLGIVFEGKAEELVYLEIDKNNINLKNAKNLSGKSVNELYDIFGKNSEVAGIGLAGEKKVRYATISCDRGTHHAGRGGSGAVMGSKNLKCVVVNKNRPNIPEEIKKLSIKYSKELRNSPATQSFINTGTMNTIAASNGVGVLPTEGWKKSQCENCDSITLESFKKTIRGRKSCYNCPLACGYSLDLNGEFNIITQKGPEYETIAMFGYNCGIKDKSSVAKLDHLCNDYGIDTISTGNILAWLMRCSEEGIIDYPIKFGDAKQSIKVLKKIAHREGELGEILSQGILKATSVYGGRKFAAECKGMDYPGYDPRGSVGMALEYATSDRGACHKRAWVVGPTTFFGNSRWDYDAQAEILKEGQDRNSLFWCYILCDFGRFAYLDDLGEEWLKLLGYDYSTEELKNLGEKVWNMTRKFNVKEGFSRKDDYLPKLMTKPVTGPGPASGREISRKDFEKMLDNYYKIRNWGHNGKPKN